MKKFKDYSWKRAKMKRIVDIPEEPDKRLILLSDAIKDTSLEGLPQDLKEYIKEMEAEIVPYTLTIGYEHLAVDEVLRKILPTGIEIPSSFEQAGHIAHLNLRPESIPYKHLIGQVILDKNPGIRTVVNKVGTIATEYRTFPMELLAGTEEYVVTLKESNANFTFNFRDVYWNSRLQTEHQRLVDLIEVDRKKYASAGKTIVVADMMAGVGPFAVPLAMEGSKVYANDLNPESYKYLEINMNKNKCKNLLSPYNMDGRDFILKMQEDQIIIDHVIMNLPQNATDFLDVFIGYNKRRIGLDGPEKMLPTIHVYGFSAAEDPVYDMACRAASTLQCSIKDLGAKVVSTATLGIVGLSGVKENNLVADSIYNNEYVVGHDVRDIAPKKMMICLSFVLPSLVADAEPVVNDYTRAVTGDHNKKRKLS